MENIVFNEKTTLLGYCGFVKKKAQAFWNLFLYGRYEIARYKSQKKYFFVLNW